MITAIRTRLLNVNNQPCVRIACPSADGTFTSPLRHQQSTTIIMKRTTARSVIHPRLDHHRRTGHHTDMMKIFASVAGSNGQLWSMVCHHYYCTSVPDRSDGRGTFRGSDKAGIRMFVLGSGCQTWDWSDQVPCGVPKV